MTRGARRHRIAPAALGASSLVAIAVLAVGWAREQPPPASGTMPRASADVGIRAGVPVSIPPVDAVGTHPARLDQLVIRDRPEPVALRIDAAGITAAVVPVGVDASGTAMAVPPDASVVAWYRNGPSPGGPGSAVLAGHVDYEGRRGVFFHLEDVEVGSVIAVDFDNGSSREFTVAARQRYDKVELPAADLFRQAGEPALALVTCGGSYDRQTRTYRDNVVVVAVPTGPPR